MAKYHRFVFNSSKREFVGKFEEMYQHEDLEGFDSWHSSNLNTLAKKIHFSILDSYNFENILDFGCGKGAFTHLLKKQNNYVLGLDISPTAINKAKQYYGNLVDFRIIHNNDIKAVIGNKKFHLTIILETLSYIKEWKAIIKNIAEFSDYLYISLYIPKDPIGFVKQFQTLLDVVSKYFSISEKIIYNDESIFLLLKNKNKE